MKKIKKIKLSEFRGIYKPIEINLADQSDKLNSAVVFGGNSTGKTSFVDGIEWFLSKESKINWLRREDAKEKAYPHQGSSGNDSYVEIDFQEDKEIKTLKKTYNHSRITQPSLSSDADFEQIYESFVIKPYLRYLEVVEFVLNRTGVEKYQELARWMGFEEELQFQEKIVLKIIPGITKSLSDISNKKETIEGMIRQLSTSELPISESSISDYANQTLKKHRVGDPDADGSAEQHKQIFGNRRMLENRFIE